MVIMLGNGKFHKCALSSQNKKKEHQFVYIDFNLLRSLMGVALAVKSQKLYI